MLEQLQFTFQLKAKVIHETQAAKKEKKKPNSKDILQISE
jgi:hypothetical protein